MAPACQAALEQAPADVTKGSVGLRDPKGTLLHDFKDMCQVNAHWHLGSEHMSEGQYDVPGADFMMNTWQMPGKDAGHRRRLLSEDSHAATPGYMCQGYDSQDPKYTTPYDWQYCKGMNVGLTYEVHWPYSSHGHCGRLSDGLGGVFCHGEAPTAIGVQGQIYVIVNDDAYDVEDLAHGINITMAQNVAKYTGSTTGSSYDNMVCSPYAPISWHVDRDCHLVSAKSFDQMCKTMSEEYSMEKDLMPHGSRELVDAEFVSSKVMDRR